MGMIETYKIITGKYQACVAPTLNKESEYVTRGNEEVYSPRRQQTIITMAINEHADRYVHGTLYKILKIKY